MKPRAVRWLYPMPQKKNNETQVLEEAAEESRLKQEKSELGNIKGNFVEAGSDSGFSDEIVYSPSNTADYEKSSDLATEEHSLFYESHTDEEAYDCNTFESHFSGSSSPKKCMKLEAVHLFDHKKCMPDSHTECSYASDDISNIKRDQSPHCTCVSCVKSTEACKNGKKYICKICEAHFNSFKYLRIHKLCKHSKKIQHVNKHMPHHCLKCDYATDNIQNLRKHMGRHNNDNLHKCPQCTYESRDKSKVERHLRVHTGEKPFKCDICQVCFADPSSMKRHKQSMHSAEKLCNFCPFKCSSRKKMILHVKRIHHKPEEYKSCGKTSPDCSSDEELDGNIPVDTNDSYNCLEERNISVSSPVVMLHRLPDAILEYCGVKLNESCTKHTVISSENVNFSTSKAYFKNCSQPHSEDKESSFYSAESEKFSMSANIKSSSKCQQERNRMPKNIFNNLRQSVGDDVNRFTDKEIRSYQVIPEVSTVRNEFEGHRWSDKTLHKAFMEDAPSEGSQIQDATSCIPKSFRPSNCNMFEESSEQDTVSTSCDITSADEIFNSVTEDDIVTEESSVESDGVEELEYPSNKFQEKPLSYPTEIYQYQNSSQDAINKSDYLNNAVVLKNKLLKIDMKYLQEKWKLLKSETKRKRSKSVKPIKCKKVCEEAEYWELREVNESLQLVCREIKQEMCKYKKEYNKLKSKTEQLRERNKSLELEYNEMQERIWREKN